MVFLLAMLDNLDGDDVVHIRLGAFARNDEAVFFGEQRHGIGERNALDLFCNNTVKIRHFF